DSEIDTPPHAAQPVIIRPLSFSKILPPAPPSVPAVEYRECMKNHAAHIGGHAVDGCGEFMKPVYAAGDAMKCAACGCHRNFHRQVMSPLILYFADIDFQVTQPGILFPFRNGLTPSPPEERQQAPVTPMGNSLSGRKRFRTKFSQEQKDKMHSFSEKIGWKMQKCDDSEVRDFCSEIGVSRGVFKVWMHNNKTLIAKKD
ncbi:hypothetical protein M569_00810, partial [Genlisea aurea]